MKGERAFYRVSLLGIINCLYFVEITSGIATNLKLQHLILCSILACYRVRFK
jgi:hypothetical protein